jgi:signal peptidase I
MVTQNLQHADYALIAKQQLRKCRSQENYYFMAGDCVSESYDSRYWGLLPEDFVVGKVAFIWKSVDPETGKFRWKRFLKPVK